MTDVNDKTGAKKKLNDGFGFSSVLCRMKTFDHSEQQLPVDAPATTTPITSSVSPVNWWNAKQPT